MSLKKILESALIESVLDSFRTVLNIGVDVSNPGEKDQFDAELICTIGTAGKLEGSISVALPNKSACEIVSQMLQEPISQITPDVCDGMREVANMIAGGIKVRIAKQHYLFETSLPTIVQGKVMRIDVRGDVEKIVKRFSSEGFVFDIEFIFKQGHSGTERKVVSGKSASHMSALARLKAMTAKAQGA